MAISANTVFEVRTTGSDTACSGGFVTGASGTDYSQQNTAQYSLTGLTSVGAGNIILTTSASADMVGNLILITAGTNFTLSTFQITSVSVGVSITVSTNGSGTAVTIGAGAAGTAVIGGALASPGQCAGVGLVNGNKIWIQSGTYTMSSASSNVSNGIVNSLIVSYWEGYGSVRGDLGTQPIIQPSVNSVTMFQLQNGGWVINLTFKGNAKTGITGIVGFGGVFFLYKVNATGCATGVSIGNNGSATLCSATLCTTAGFTQGGASNVFGCVSYANTGIGFNLSNSLTITSNCIAYGNGTNGFSGTTPSTLINCTSYGNAMNGYVFPTAANVEVLLVNCIAEANGTFGFNFSSLSGSNLTMMVNCASYNNTSGSVNLFGGIHNIGFITNTTGSFFTNPAGHIFQLNNTANQGALARAAGILGIFPDGNTVAYYDIGASQHQDVGGGGTTVIYPIFD